jgi:hypothetical protein
MKAPAVVTAAAWAAFLRSALRDGCDMPGCSFFLKFGVKHLKLLQISVRRLWRS